MKARLTVTALALALASIAGTAVAKTPANKSQYEADRAFCSSAQAYQERQACMKEAAAARRAGQGSQLTQGDYQRNAEARCARQPEGLRASCLARVHGQGNTSTTGSVLGGGTISEHVEVTQQPASAPATAPAPAHQ